MDSEGSRREFTIAGGIAEPDTEAKNFAAQEKESVFAVAFAETKGESTKNARGRARSFADSDRNAGGHAKAESEEVSSETNVAKRKEKKENRRRKIAVAA